MKGVTTRRTSYPSRLLTERQLTLFEGFLATVRPWPAHRVARAMTRLNPGITWTHCPKGYMAEAWAVEHAPRAGQEHLDSHRGLRRFTLAQLVKEIEA